MRKREIHSIAHWAMMFILLMFPLLMVVVGAFQNAEYQPFTVYENITEYDDLHTGNQYRFIFQTNEVQNNTGSAIYYDNINVVDTNISDLPDLSLYNNFTLTWADNRQYVSFKSPNLSTITFNSITQRLVFDFTLVSYSKGANQNMTFTEKYNGDIQSISYIDNYHYKNDVNLWTKSFLDLPVNAWYKSLMNTIGVGFTNSSVMNVIYVMPVYILWVFMFDVIVDCFLVIIKLPHKLLNRLSGGENE